MVVEQREDRVRDGADPDLDGGAVGDPFRHVGRDGAVGGVGIWGSTSMRGRSTSHQPAIWDTWTWFGPTSGASAG